MCRRRRCRNISRPNAANAGFTLIEVLVALAVVATTFAAIGAVIATNARNTRTMEERLALASVAETVINSIADRGAVQPGQTSGELLDRSWRMYVLPLPRSSEAAPSLKWEPFAVSVQVQAVNGQAMQVTTVRMLPRSIP